MKMISLLTILTTMTVISSSCVQKANSNTMMNDFTIAEGLKTDTATLGTGCFWCTEAIFQQLKGVLKVSSGYSGGHVVNPTYEQVCDKNTGHAEVVQVVYDPAQITFDELLKVFWETHDPTTLNRQGNDVGPQYRSVVFYHNDEQKQKAEQYKQELEKVVHGANQWLQPLIPIQTFMWRKIITRIITTITDLSRTAIL